MGRRGRVLGLTAETRPTEANAVVEAVDELLGLLKEIRSLQERINDIDATPSGFAKRSRNSCVWSPPNLIDRLQSNRPWSCTSA